MSAKKKHPKIERTSGPYPTNRFGIRFATLSKSQKRLLIENPLLKERCQSDAFALILFEQSKTLTTVFAIRVSFDSGVVAKLYVNLHELIMLHIF